MTIKLIYKSLLITFLITVAAGCNKSESKNNLSKNDTPLKVSAPNNSTESIKNNTISQNVNHADEEGLLFMWEEEKLARDIYTNMYDRYGKEIFLKISKSEQQHMDAVKRQLDIKSLSTPVNPKSIGTFKNPELAKLYTELIARGNISLGDAYRVGLDIELKDIEDLVQRMEATNDPAIKKVYQYLINGSNNHKAAFEKKL